MKKGVTITGLILLCCCICALFWFSEWKYSLPTPLPVKYAVINTGEQIHLSENTFPVNDKPLFLHFFNPDCPCSKFNIPHFKTLVAKYGEKIDFAVVVMTKDKDYSPDYIRQKFGLSITVLIDSSIALSCGVYSTPQAVLLTNNHLLYYRGNYNRNRYCTNSKSNYAQMAIDSLLTKNLHPVFDNHALVAYGCSLPTCTK